MNQQQRIDWRAVNEVVYVTLPTCPSCGATEHVIVRSEANGDGSTTRKAICQWCRSPFKICVELPESED